MQKLKRTLGNFMFLLRPYWKYGKQLIIVSLGFTALFVFRIAAEMTITQRIIEAAQSGRGTRHIIITAGAYIAFIFGAWLAREARVQLYESWKLVEIQSKIEREIYGHAITTDFKYVDSPSYFDSYKMATEEYVTNCQKLYDLVFGTSSIITDIFGFGTALGLIAMIQPWTLLIAGAGIGISAVFRWKRNVVNNAIWKETTTDRRKMNYLTRLLYTKSANSELRSTNTRSKVMNLFNGAVDGRIQTAKKYRRRQFLNGGLSLIGSRLTPNLATTFTAIQFALGKLASVALFTTVLSATNNLQYHFNEAINNFTELMTLTLYAEKIRNFFELKSDIEPSTGDADAPVGAMSLELRDVSFAYPNSEFALKNVNISIAAGEKIAIVGENGAGKTTLSKLLLRLYDVGGGELLYNGTPIREYDVHALRRKIGVAFQEPQLYALTVRDNMQTYNSASDEVLRETLKTVGLDIDLDREVTREFDEGGVMLSGGQAQKLGLSRLLIGDFGLLLLDEPSSALDPLAEYQMMKLMFDASRTTTVMVAHRLSTIRNADRIYLVDNGEIAEQGTHDELMSLGGKYAEMFSKQGENYTN